MKVGLNPDDAKLILRYLDGQLTEMEHMDDEDILEEGESWWDRRHEILRLMANLRAAIAEAEPQGYDAEGVLLRPFSQEVIMMETKAAEEERDWCDRCGYRRVPEGRILVCGKCEGKRFWVKRDDRGFWLVIDEGREGAVGGSMKRIGQFTTWIDADEMAQGLNETEGW